VNTASSVLLGKALSDSDGILHRELEGLLQGDTIEKRIDDHVSYHQEGIHPHDVWSFLVFSGYLTFSKQIWRDDSDNSVGILKIPNREVLIAFKNLIRDWTEHRVGGDTQVFEMLDGLVRGDRERFEGLFRELVRNTLSFHDVTLERSESFYHAFVIGLLVYLNGTHEIRSNRESGYGRYDVMIFPRDPSKYPGVVIEFKTVLRDSTVEETLESAHRQICDKEYVSELRSRGCTRVVQWAIVFRGKEVWVSVLEDSF
jgi:hypothetical protein